MPVLASRGARAATALGLAGDGFPPAALALFARMSPTPSPARKVLISQTIAALTIAGVWQKLDMLQVYAADAQANALLNWISSSYNASLVNTPTFTTDRGFTFNGTTQYLDTGYNPSTGPKWGQNSHTFGRWMRSGSAGNVADLGVNDGSGRTATIASNAAGVAYTVGDSSVTSTQATSPIGNIAAVRSVAGSFDIYKAGASVANIVAVSNSGANLNFYVAALNLSGAAANFSSNEYSATYVGQSLNSTEMAALHSALQAYMTGVGA